MSVYSNLGEINLGEFNLGDNPRTFDAIIADTLNNGLDAITTLLDDAYVRAADDSLDTWTDQINFTFNYRRVIEEDFDGLVDAIVTDISRICQVSSDDVNLWLDDITINFRSFEYLSLNLEEDDLNNFNDTIETLLHYSTTVASNLSYWNDNPLDEVILQLDYCLDFGEDDLNLWNVEAALRLDLFISIDEDLNNFDDILDTFAAYFFESTDDLNNFNDALAILNLYSLSVSSNLNSWYDYELETHLGIYLEPLLCTLEDDINSLGYNIDSIEYFFDTLYACGDSLFFTDTIDVCFEYQLYLVEDLNVWDDGVIVMPGEFVALSYDEMTSTWADVISVQFTQERTFADDACNLADSVSVSLAVTHTTRTATDSLNNWNDIIRSSFLVKRIIADWLALHDEIELLLKTSLRIGDALTLTDAVTRVIHPSLTVVVEDTLSLSDAVVLSLATSEKTGTFDDSLSLWEELVRVEFKQRMHPTDTMALSDTIEIEQGDGDLSYIRRYLNDVIR